MAHHALRTKQTNELTQQLIEQGIIVDPNSAKGRLLKAAAKLFRDQGFERTTVRELAKEVGIQSGSLFHHYASKQDILLSVVEQTVLLNTQILKQALALNHSSKDKVQALIHCELQSVLIDTDHKTSVMIYEWRRLNDSNREIILGLRDDYEQLWIETLTQAKADGIVTIDPLILRRLLIGAISWSVNWFKDDGELSLQELAQITLSLALK